MDKTISWFLEKWGGGIIGFIVGAIFFLKCPLTGLLNSVETFVSKISDVSFIIFGFLLAFIGLILNSKKKIIKAFGSKLFFDRTIDFNIRVIVLSAITGIYGLFLWIIFQSNLNVNSRIQELLVDLLIWVLVWLIWDIVYFIRIFFSLIKNYS